MHFPGEEVAVAGSLPPSCFFTFSPPLVEAASCRRRLLRALVSPKLPRGVGGGVEDLDFEKALPVAIATLHPNRFCAKMLCD
jgi:hypothetical protein